MCRRFQKTRFLCPCPHLAPSCCPRSDDFGGRRLRGKWAEDLRGSHGVPPPPRPPERISKKPQSRRPGGTGASGERTRTSPSPKITFLPITSAFPGETLVRGGSRPSLRADLSQPIAASPPLLPNRQEGLFSPKDTGRGGRKTALSMDAATGSLNVCSESPPAIFPRETAERGRERFLARLFTEHRSHHTLLDPPHFSLANVCKSDTW